MDLVVIAQIITGTATLIVAMVLLYQLRQQHKDAEIQISMMSETLNERLFNFGNFDKEYYEVIYKGQKLPFDKFNDFEKWKFDKWANLVFRRIVQDWRLGRAKRNSEAYKIAFLSLLRYQASHYIYINHFRKLLISFEDNPVIKSGLLRIADDTFEEISGEKIVN